MILRFLAPAIFAVTVTLMVAGCSEAHRQADDPVRLDVYQAFPQITLSATKAQTAEVGLRMNSIILVRNRSECQFFMLGKLRNSGTVKTVSAAEKREWVFTWVNGLAERFTLGADGATLNPIGKDAFYAYRRIN